MDWSGVDYWDVFYQLFGLSFWRHPFTADDPFLSKWCNATFLQIWWRNKLIVWGWVHFQQMFRWTTPLANVVVAILFYRLKSVISKYKWDCTNSYKLATDLPRCKIVTNCHEIVLFTVTVEQSSDTGVDAGFSTFSPFSLATFHVYSRTSTSSGSQCSTLPCEHISKHYLYYKTE